MQHDQGGSPIVKRSPEYIAARESLQKGAATPEQQKLLFEKLRKTEELILGLREANMQGW